VPDDRYVIVGGGFAAAVDHSTLLRSSWGRARVENLTITQVYEEQDPWLRHVDHRMGQWPGLLALPGFGERHLAEPSREFLSSRRFAEANKSTHDATKHEIVIGRVVDLRRHNDYELDLILEGRPNPVRAKYIDLCTGPGKMRWMQRWRGDRTSPRTIRQGVYFGADALWTEYRNPDLTKLDRRVLPAELFMARTFAVGHQVCIVGTGPLAASCVERALSEGATSVLWVGMDSFAGSFPPSGRYDALVTTASGPLPVRSDFPDTATDLFSVDARLELVPAHQLLWVDTSSSSANTLEAFLVPRKGGPSRLFVADQIALSASSQTQYDEPDSVAALLDRLRRASPIPVPMDPIRLDSADVLQGIPFGFQTPLGDLRVLGVAALGHPDFSSSVSTTLRQYEATLPGQARVDLRGITLSAIAIAQANRFFRRTPNHSVNTAHEWELAALLDATSGFGLADIRGKRRDPFVTLSEAGLTNVELVTRYEDPDYYWP
jgi:hypothetical protein